MLTCADGALALLLLQGIFLELDAGVLKLAALGAQKEREAKIDPNFVIK